jgi:hypothetical protein
VNQQLMLLSVAAVSPDVNAPRTMQLQVHIQGHKFLFLVDSGSSACFIDEEKAKLLTGLRRLPIPIPVKVAGGAVLQSTTFFPICSGRLVELNSPIIFGCCVWVAMTVSLDWIGWENTVL